MRERSDERDSCSIGASLTDHEPQSSIDEAIGYVSRAPRD